MEEYSTLESVRGTADLLPPAYYTMDGLRVQLRSCFEGFGYIGIEPPVLEYTELFLKKSGEDIISKLYAFEHHGRRLCLRPEFTASVARLFVNHLQGAALPLRLYYGGPAFRYEKPQRGRTRQFTQTGVELIGAASPVADAEIIALASQGLEAIGLGDHTIEIGHIGVVQLLLRSLGLNEVSRSLILDTMQHLSPNGRGLPYVQQRIRTRYPELRLDLPGEEGDAGSASDNGAESTLTSLAELVSDPLSDLPPERVKGFIRSILHEMRINLEGNRDPEEVIERFISKMETQKQLPALQQGLALVQQLQQFRGPAREMLPRLEMLVEDHGVEKTIVRGLAATVELLSQAGLEAGKILVNLGMGRGLQYYDGLIFEIYSPALSGEIALATGGRYDGLTLLLGSRDKIPACGFAFILERLQLARAALQLSEALPPTPDVLVLPVEPANYGYAVRVCTQLRGKGLRVVLEVKDRGLKAGLRYSDHLGVPYVALIGTTEEEGLMVTIRNMTTRQEQAIALADLDEFTIRGIK